MKRKKKKKKKNSRTEKTQKSFDSNEEKNRKIWFLKIEKGKKKPAKTYPQKNLIYKNWKKKNHKKMYHFFNILVGKKRKKNLIFNQKKKKIHNCKICTLLASLVYFFFLKLPEVDNHAWFALKNLWVLEFLCRLRFFQWVFWDPHGFQCYVAKRGQNRAYQ